jgi:hypothetical protein
MIGLELFKIEPSDLRWTRRLGGWLPSPSPASRDGGGRTRGGEARRRRGAQGLRGP